MTKQVTMDYQEHENLLKELEELKEAKLCVLTYMQFIGRAYFSSNSSVIDDEDQLKNKINDLIEDKKEQIFQSYIIKISRYKSEIIKLKEELAVFKALDEKNSFFRKIFQKYF